MQIGSERRLIVIKRGYSSVGFRVKVEGLDDLKKRIDQLTAETRKKVLGPACAAGALVVVKEAKKTTAFTDRSGDLRAAIKQRRASRESKQDYELRHVGVFKSKTGRYANTKRNVRLGRAGKAYAEDPPEFYWRFLELGSVRDPPGKPFLRKAFQASRQRAVEAIKARLAQKLDEVTRKLNPATNPRKR